MFDPHNGKQIKGGFVRDPKFISKYYYMPKYYYDKDNGCKVTHAGFVNENDSTYYLDDKGQIVLGLQEINGDFYYFRPENTYKHYDIGEMLRDVLSMKIIRSIMLIIVVKSWKIAFSNVMEDGIILQKMVQLQQEKLKLMVKTILW